MLNKKLIAKFIADKYQLNRIGVIKVVDETFSIIKEALLDGEVIKIREIGTFFTPIRKLNQCPAPRYIIKWKPSKLLKIKVAQKPLPEDYIYDGMPNVQNTPNKQT